MFSFQDLVKIAEEMKGFVDQSGGTLASLFYPAFLRPDLLSACSGKGRDAVLCTWPHGSSLFLVGMLGVGADLPRDGAGALLLTQMHHKCFPFLFQHKNAVTEHSGLNTILDIQGIKLHTCSSTARKISVPCYLHVVGEKNNFSTKPTC